jgi:hypothetical protein
MSPTRSFPNSKILDVFKWKGRINLNTYKEWACQNLPLIDNNILLALPLFLFGNFLLGTSMSNPLELAILLWKLTHDSPK